MAKLPTKQDLGNLPSARTGRPIARYDVTAVGEGAQQLGRGISQAGTNLAKAASQVDPAKEFEAERRFQEFKWKEQLDLDKAMRETEPGQAEGFADRWADQYKERAGEFARTLPDPLRGKYDNKLFSVERDYYGASAKFAREEQKRFALGKLDEIKNTYLSRAVANEPLDKIRGDYKSLLDANPYLTPIDRAEEYRDGAASLEEAHIQGRIDRGDSLADILRDIRGNTPDDGDDAGPRMRTGASAQASISVQLETGKTDPLEGVANISRDAGGTKSYGNFGLNSQRGGSIFEFVKEYGDDLELKGKPGTAEFDRSWQKAAAEAPNVLHAAEMDWYTRNVTSDITKRLSKAGVPDSVAKDPRVKAYFADRSIQQGTGSIDQVKKHRARINEALAAADGDPVEFLKNITELDRAALESDFPTALRTGVYSERGHDTRLDGRLQLALGMDESLIPGEETTNIVEFGPYRHISAERRNTLVNKAKIAVRNNTLQAIRDGAEEIRRTGRPSTDAEGQTAIQRAKSVLTKNQFDKAKLDWAEAELEYSALNDLDMLREEQIQERLDEIAPRAGDDLYDIKAKIFDKAIREADDVRDQREKDPARSVSNFPAVQEAVELVRQNPDDPEAIQTLARARIDAQEKVGVPEGLRTPITKAEARIIMAPIRRLSEAARIEALMEIQEKLQGQYGPYARSAAISAIEYIVRGRDLAEELQSVVANALEGQPASAAQQRRIEQLSEIERADQAFGYVGEPGRQFPTETTSEMGGRPPALDPFRNYGQSPEQMAGKKRLPPRRAIEALKANPDLRDQFEEFYGAGSSEQYLNQ